MTIALATRRTDFEAQADRRRRRIPRVLKRILLTAVCTIVGLVAVVAAYAGWSLYRIDHAVHHVGVPASLLAKGKNDLLALVKGPHGSEEIYVFHDVGGHTNILRIPSALGLPLAGGHTVPIKTLSLHDPAAIISGLDRLGIPVSRYVGVDLHMVDPASDLGRLATGDLSITSLISNPAGTSSLLQAVASHVYLGPGTPVSALLSLMHVPTAHPVSVPTARDGQGRVVLASAFVDVMRGFL